jgi:hypothetical protein
VTACTACATPLAPVPAPPGSLGAVWAHAIPPADGHAPGVPPVTVIYRRDRDSWDAECSEVPGFPVHGAASLDEAKSVASTLLLAISPPRPVIERMETADGKAS